MAQELWDDGGYEYMVLNIYEVPHDLDELQAMSWEIVGRTNREITLRRELQ